VKEKPISNIALQYDLFQSSFERTMKPKKYLNFGYTTSKYQSLEERQEQLCREVFKLACFKDDDVIVDVGFGSGEQDFLLASLKPFKKLVGFNISQKQVDYANARAERENLEKRMTFHNSPAEEMGMLRNSSVDKIIAIESSFYFDRPRFYQEAARVIRKGGSVVLADLFFNNKLSFLVDRSKKMRRVGTISLNRVSWEKYFETKELINISVRVIPGVQKAVSKCFSSIFKKVSLPELRFWLKMGVSSQIICLGLLTRIIQYRLIVLEKK
jgi:ubiquinone/menaquinone biosynthesis C-methylase UbiE